MIVNLQNKAEFVDKFLKPVSRISNKCIFNIASEGIHSILCTDDHSIVLYSQYTTELDVDEPVDVSVPDLMRFIKILECVDASTMSLELTSNNIQYKSSNIKFKYHLLENGILKPPAIDAQKIEQLEYDTHFSMPYTSLISLIKSGGFTLDINKVYLMTKDDDVYAEIDDKQAHNVDSICLKICEGYRGLPIDSPLPVSFETVRTLAGSRCENVEVSINTKLNVMQFVINTDNIKSTYIISGLAT